MDSITQRLRLDGIVDGVSGNDAAAQQTIQRIQQQLRNTPNVYLPSHDPESARRPEQRETVAFAAPNHVEELHYLILAAQREGNRMLAEALRPLDVTPSQAEVLRVLQDYQSLSLIALGELLVCETGSPSRLVHGMVEAGLIERVTAPTNRRMVKLTLSARGLQKADQIRAVEEAMHHVILRSLPPDTSLTALNALLWNFIADRPSGTALNRRTGRS